MSEMVFCRGCGKEIHNTAPVCPGCGAPQRTGRRIKNKTVAALLALFLGGLGIHRFYLGQWWGIFYLLFCWTGIPQLVCIVEALVIALTNTEKWDARYNQGVPSGDSGVGSVVVIVIAAVLGVAIIGILAAIALPAYQDYVTRAKVAQAVMTIQQATPSVAEYIERNSKIPGSLQLAGFDKPLPESISGVAINQRTGEIQVTLTGASTIHGKTFSMLPSVGSDKHIAWHCVSETLPNKALPAACRS